MVVSRRLEEWSLRAGVGVEGADGEADEVTEERVGAFVRGREGEESVCCGSCVVTRKRGELSRRNVVFLATV